MKPTEPLLVAIDGPAGVGKSTAARGLAERLGIPYLDTGAMYRAVALKALAVGVAPADRSAVEELAASIDLELASSPGGDLVLLLDGEPVGERIRTPEVSAASSVVAAHPGVRRRLVELQREGGLRLGGVIEGRDIGSRVFPDAPFKFFFEADPVVRSKRRYAELRQKGRDVAYEDVLRELASRDARDQSRGESPLICPQDAIRLDTSSMSPDEVVEAMVAVVRASDLH